MSKIKVALVGTGSISHCHLPVYKSREDVELVAVADIDFEKAKRVAEQYGVPQAYASVEELLADTDVDMVDVCTWPAAHAPVTIAAANAGKHVICEKPTCHNLESALAMREAVQRNGVLFELAVPLRYQKCARYIREKVDAGEFGEVYYGRTAYVRQRGIPGGWFSCTEYSGGGPLIDIGVHTIDLAWYAMGCPKPVSVSASASYRMGDYRPDSADKDTENGWAGATVANYKFDVEDSACGFFRFENGATLYFDTSWSFNGPAEHATMIAGSKAGATLEPFRIFKGDGAAITEEIPEGDFGGNFFEHEIDHFLECIKTGATPSSDIEQAVQLEAMLFGVYESAKAGKEIELHF